jgi:hypothetical protein
MAALEAIESYLREEQAPDPAADIVRGWPLTVDGLLRNAESTRGRYTWKGQPVGAISTEITGDRFTLGTILAGPRLRTRSRYACAPVRLVVESGFELLPTFGEPHYSLLLPSYDETSVRKLLRLLGEVERNPFFVGRQP